MNLDLRIALLGGTVNYSENVVTRRAVASPVNQDSVDSDNVHSERKILENITKDLNCLQERRKYLKIRILTEGVTYPYKGSINYIWHKS